MPTKPGYRVFIDISSFKQVSRGGNKHWLIMVDEFSDYTHSFFLKKKSDQIKILPMWIKGIAKNTELKLRGLGLTTVEKTKASKKNVTSKTLELFLSSQHLELLNKFSSREENTNVNGQSKSYVDSGRA